MKVLVTGGSGYLGGAVIRQISSADYDVTATYRNARSSAAGVGWHRLDVRRRADVEALFGLVRPELVVHTAARMSDWATTADGSAHVALAAAAVGARLVHVSSDAVFSGSDDAYDEASAPDPVTAYGAAKSAAETAVKAISPAALIVRTSLILGDGRSVHESFVHSLADGRTEGILFTDVVRCPVHVSDLAAALIELARTDRSGVAHVAGSEAVTRYQLGLLVAHRDGLDPSSIPSGPRPATYPPGPSDIRLDCTKTQRILTTRLRGASEFLA